MNSEYPSSPRESLSLCIIVASFVLGLSFNMLFWEQSVGMNIPIFSFLILFFLSLLGMIGKTPLSNRAFWLMIPIAFFAFMPFVYASIPLTLINLFTLLILFSMLAQTAVRPTSIYGTVSKITRSLILPLFFIKPFIQTVSDSLHMSTNARGNETIRGIIRGLIISLPFLAVFGILFSQADDVFGTYAKHIIPTNFTQLPITQAILVMSITFFFIGAYGFSFSTHEKEKKEEPSSSRKQNERMEILTVLTLVNMLFFLFLLVQFHYFFGSSANISEQGFTYAEYARKGFSELVLVSLLSFLLARYTERKMLFAQNLQSPLKVLVVVLIIQVMVVIYSAFQRLSLYEAAYGFTNARFYGHAIIFFIAGGFVLLLYKIFTNQSERAYSLRVFLLFLVGIATVNLINPEAFIAKKNIERYWKTGNIDGLYIVDLSSDATPTTVSFFKTLRDIKTKRELGEKLYEATNQANHTPKDWQSSNLSRMKERSTFSSIESSLAPYAPIWQTHDGKLFR